MDISGQIGKKGMDISHVTNPSSSKSTRPDEVFLSSRGRKMHRGFADFLYTSLADVGICVFWNEDEMESGKKIDPHLMQQAIEQSKVSIPVISKAYASSKSCLRELDQMVKCMMDNKNRIIIPIFYYVDPSDARDCSGPFAGALGEQKKCDRDGTIRRIGQLEGHHLHEKNEGSHGEVVKQIVHQVQQKLKKQDLIVTKQFVRVDSHVQDIMAKLKVDYRNGQAVKIGETSVTVLGIYGIPGVGKTVLAKYVYNQLYHLFDACSFLGEIQANIRHKDHNIVSLQKKLISDLHKGNAEKDLLRILENFPTKKVQNFPTKKVLILLDDVYDHKQLRELVGNLDWLDLGSTVILTSQRQDVIRNINGAERFFLEPMEEDEALKLFCRHAFGTDSSGEEFKGLSRDIVDATDRLPLALEVTGSSLFLIKSKKVWRETLTALQVSPHARVQVALEKSYAYLDKNAQEIFLDIACFFTGMDMEIPYYMWHDCRYQPSTTIQALQARSFIKIVEDKKLFVHEILKKFGREIVKNENRNEPCRRSRLWNHREALDVLGRREGTKNVKALSLKFDDPSERNISFGCRQFNGLQSLMFLKLDRANIQGYFGNRLSSLRWLDWQGCPETFHFKSLHLNLPKLVILDLSWSKVDKDWGGWDLLKQARKLKVLKLTGCVQLTSTPKFPASMELERLILEGCFLLKIIHRSFGNLKKLKTLSLKKCKGLSNLPDDIGKLSSLQFLDLSETLIRELPSSVKDLKDMKVLRMRETSIQEFPKDILNLKKLEEIDFTSCRSLAGKIPDDIGGLSSLAILKLSDTSISDQLPPSISRLSRLPEIHISRCL